MLSASKINSSDLEKAINCLTASGVLGDDYAIVFESEDVDGTVQAFVNAIDELSDDAAEKLGKDKENNFALKFYNTLVAEEEVQEAPKVKTEKPKTEKPKREPKAKTEKPKREPKVKTEKPKKDENKPSAEERKAAAEAKREALKAERAAAKAAKKAKRAEEIAKRKADKEAAKAAKKDQPPKERTVFGTIKGTQAAMIDEMLLSGVGYTDKELAAATQSNVSRVKSHMYTLMKVKGAILAKDENGKWSADMPATSWDPATAPARPPKRKKTAEEAPAEEAPVEEAEEIVEEASVEEAEEAEEFVEVEEAEGPDGEEGEESAK